MKNFLLLFSINYSLHYKECNLLSWDCWQAYAAAGTLKQNYASILLLLLRLRQACDHPFLVKGFNSDTIGKYSFDMARQLPREMLINLLNQLEGSLAICAVCSVSDLVLQASFALFFLVMKNHLSLKRISEKIILDKEINKTSSIS